MVPRVSQYKCHHRLRPVAFIAHHGDCFLYLVLNSIPMQEDRVGCLADTAPVLKVVHEDLAQVGMVLTVISLEHFIAWGCQHL